MVLNPSQKPTARYRKSLPSRFPSAKGSLLVSTLRIFTSLSATSGAIQLSSGTLSGSSWLIAI